MIVKFYKCWSNLVKKINKNNLLVCTGMYFYFIFVSMEIHIIKEIKFGNQNITVLSLINKNGCEVVLTNYGATIISILVPTDSKNKKDITLGYQNIDELLKNHHLPERYYFGSTIGRFANRIANGQFYIDKIKYQLTQNEGNNHLHGGNIGLNKIIWNYELIKNAVLFSHYSPDGFEGYPGNLSIKLLVSLSDTNEIKLEYMAHTDKTTPISLTNHIYFNLNGEEKNILNHSIKLNSDSILEVDKMNIPSGKIIKTNGTDYDLNTPKLLNDSGVIIKGGYDNCYILKKSRKDLKLAAEISVKNNPINLQVFTTEPSMQFYTSNGFDGSFTGKNKITYNKFQGLCLEAQQFPDSPNHVNFTNSMLKPGETYQQKTIYKINF